MIRFISKSEAKKSLVLATPIILGEMVHIIMGMIDSAMIGSVSYEQLAASSLVLSITNIPFVIGIGISIAIAQLVAQAHGEGNDRSVSHTFYNGMLLTTVVAVVISACLFFGNNVVYYMKQDGVVAQHAAPFLSVISLSIIPMILFISLKQFTDGLQFTKTAMIISVLSLPLNIFLNWLLIYGNWGLPRLELFGAGLATLIARSAMVVALAMVVYKNKRFQRYIQHKKEEWHLSFKTQEELLRIGVPSAIQIAMESGAFAISGILVGMIGAEEQAAHQIALIIATFTFMVSFGLAQATTIRVSNALGQSRWYLIKKIGYSNMALGVSYGVFCAIFFYFAKNYLPYLFNDDINVVEMATQLIFLAAIFQLPDAIQVIAASLLRGIKDVYVPTVFIIIAYWVIGIPSGCYLAFYADWGPSGIWIGLILGLSVVSVLLVSRFFSRKEVKLAIPENSSNK